MQLLGCLSSEGRKKALLFEKRSKNFCQWACALNQRAARKISALRGI
jgi:hypothetical protein